MSHGADPLKTRYRAEHETSPMHKAIEMGNITFMRRFTEIFAKELKLNRVKLQSDCNGATPLLR